MASADLIHPHRGLLPSSNTMPIIRKLGLDLLFFYRVVVRALLLQRELSARNIQLPVSVRASAAVLTSPGMPETLERWMQDFALSTAFLRVEFEAGPDEKSTGDVIAALQSLHAKGFGLSLAEFSIDNPMLKFLSRTSRAQVKIGAHLIAGVRANDADMAMVGMLIRLAKALGLDVVAEGVERREQADQLLAWGCDMGQSSMFDIPPVVVDCLGSVNSGA